jgi:hypothetical protein
MSGGQTHREHRQCALFSQAHTLLTYIENGERATFASALCVNSKLRCESPRRLAVRLSQEKDSGAQRCETGDTYIYVWRAMRLFYSLLLGGCDVRKHIITGRASLKGIGHKSKPEHKRDAARRVTNASAMRNLRNCFPRGTHPNGNNKNENIYAALSLVLRADAEPCSCLLRNPRKHSRLAPAQ